MMDDLGSVLARALVIILLVWFVGSSQFFKRRHKKSLAERRQQSAVSHFMRHTVHSLLLKQQAYSTLLPLLDHAPRTSVRNFRAGHVLDCRSCADGAFAIVAPKARSLLPKLTKLAKEHASQWRVDEVSERAALDALVEALLLHVDASAYGRSLTLSDCINCGVGLERGAPFPMIHTDTEWDLWPACGGFQLWYLLSADSACPMQGNMFMVDAASSTGRDPPTAYHFHPSGAVLKARNSGGDAPAPETAPTYGRDKETLCEYASTMECGFAFRYLDLAPGECMLMNRHMLHMSDPRPHLAGRSVDRLALTMRVVLKPPGSGSKSTLMDTTAAAYAGKALPRVFGPGTADWRM